MTIINQEDPSNTCLLIVIFLSIVDNVEEAELVNTLAGRNHTKPISQLLLLEEFLCPVTSISLILPKYTYDIKSRVTYKYLR